MTQRRLAALAKLSITVVVAAATLAGCADYGRRHHSGRYSPPSQPWVAGPSSPPAPLPPPPRPKL
ncbi:hypothetical protein [Brevundimonas goettingensis]|uniref:Lipoprotein n=1 Tax=Brevundimonas goettingensis TaxID=2774190 RepID=A0A975GYQ9_9CAUL|nr:hypothetical protein [Brevundimonas goettingensis]QTC91855.1 hypothetical protein IFJ75_02685 [Brevundimonas goettingensis]